MRIWRYGDDVNTDMLFPGKYTYTCSTACEIIPHLLEDLDPGFACAVKPGDIIVAGRNFGCGSSREQPVVGLAAVGLAAVVACSFARIFYRAAINQGLLLVECPGAVGAYREGDRIDLDATAGRITVTPGLGPDATGGAPGGTAPRLGVPKSEFLFASLPPEILAIKEAGGLLAYTRAGLARTPRGGR